LELRDRAGKLEGRWIANVPGFEMPAQLRAKGSDYSLVNLRSDRFSEIKIPNATSGNIEVDTFNFYIGVLRH
jgi:hypothetical protein